MTQTVILADDLSGAADCGVACVHAGLQTLLTLGQPVQAVDADALAIDANTRRLDRSSAALRMQSLAASYAADPSTLLFKKIDSTLRGNVGAELAAVLQSRRTVVKGAVAVMAAALPASGRTAVNGIVHVHGQPLHETEIWRNEETTGEAYLPAMLHEAGLTCVHLELAVVRGSDNQLYSSMSAAARKTDVLLCDAMTDADLAVIAKAADELRPRVVWVGSAGLAHHLPHARRGGRRSSTEPAFMSGTVEPVVFVIGSMCRTAREQVARLGRLRGVQSFTLPADVLLAGPDSSAWRNYAMEIEAAAMRKEDILLSLAAVPEVEIRLRLQLSQQLAEMTDGLSHVAGALVASGGETARMILDRWGISSLLILGEMEQGVPVSRAMRADNTSLTVVTKAGDFGNAETLAHCRELLHNGGGAHR